MKEKLIALGWTDSAGRAVTWEMWQKLGYEPDPALVKIIRRRKANLNAKYGD